VLSDKSNLIYSSSFSLSLKTSLVLVRSYTNKAIIPYSEDSLVFRQLINFLSTSPINESTQIIIERYLIDQFKIYQLKKDKSQANLKLDTSSIHSIFYKELLKYRVDLFKVMTNFVKENSHLVVNESQSKKNKNLHYLLLYKIVTVDYIVHSSSLSTKTLQYHRGFEYLSSILLGRVLRIINNVDFKDNIQTNLSIDLGNDLINYYYSVKYSKYLDSIQKHSNNEYKSFSVWKIDNLENLFNTEDSVLALRLGSILIS